MPPRADYDLVAIGAGSGGVAAARRAAQHGARVAIVERDRVGGTCVNRGCVPKKLMMYAAEFGALAASARAFGWSAACDGFDAARFVAAKDAEVQRLDDAYEAALAGSGVELIRGSGVFAGARSVAVGARTISAAHVLVATGGSPVRDAVPGLAQALTSDDALSLQRLPGRVAVLGGGYIGVEFASILAGLGVEVTLIMRSEHPLRSFDDDLRRRLSASLAARGIRVAAGRAPVRVECTPAGASVMFDDHPAIHADALLNATGRRPNTAGLGLEAIGIRLDAKGAIPVDACGRTAAPGIYAIGDVTDRNNLTPVAIAEGRAFADTVFAGQATAFDRSLVATAVFAAPPLATVGLTESAACRRGRTRVYEAEFRPMKSAFAGSPERTYMKLVVDDASDVVLGVHMLGADAPEIVQGLAVALAAGATKRDFDRTVAMHPTAAEEFVLMREPTRVLPATGERAPPS